MRPPHAVGVGRASLSESEPDPVFKVKVGGGKGIVSQIQTSQQLTNLPVIGFDANGIVGARQSFRPSVMKNAQQKGITIVNNLDDLMNILRSGGN